MIAKPTHFLASLALLAILIATGCGGSDNIKPAPPHALAQSKVAAITGSDIRMNDGSTISLPSDFPRPILESPGLTLINANVYDSGALLISVCAQSPQSLSALLESRITALGWTVVQSTDLTDTSTRGYRKGQWALEIFARTEQDFTHVTTQMENAEPSAP